MGYTSDNNISAFENDTPVPVKKRKGSPGKRTDDDRTLTMQKICQTMVEHPTWSTIDLLNGTYDFPDWSVFHSWIARRPDWRAMYNQAQEMQANILASEIISIADDSARDRRTDERGVTRIDNEVVNRSRVRIDARKWLASKKAPHLFGEKIVIENTGTLNIHTNDELMNKKLELFNRLQARAGILPKLTDISVIEADFEPDI